MCGGASSDQLNCFVVASESAEFGRLSSRASTVSVERVLRAYVRGEVGQRRRGPAASVAAVCSELRRRWGVVVGIEYSLLEAFDIEGEEEQVSKLGRLLGQVFALKACTLANYCTLQPGSLVVLAW